MEKFSYFKIVDYIFLFFSVVFVGLAIYGAYNNYVDIAFWDSWASYQIFQQVQDGYWSSLWYQHNEHRIPVTLFLFWANFFFFGKTWPLIALNYLLAGAICWIFIKIWKEAGEKYIFVPLFLISWLFCWSQKENFTWEFQGTFFLAQLLPLLSLFLLYKSQYKRKSDFIYFLFACVCGFLSAWTLASGIITLPLMFVYAIFLSIEKKRCIVLLLISILSFCIYFYGYKAPPHHGGVLETLLASPLEVTIFALSYLGGPFFHIAHTISGERVISEYIALIASVFGILSFLLFSLRMLKEPRSYALQFVLLFFILYVGITAVGTSCGRVKFGLDMAFSGRYQTPVLMAWSSLLLLYVPSFKAFGKYIVCVWGLLLIIMLSLLPIQKNALENNDQLFPRSVAALALNMSVPDSEALKTLYPDPVVVSKISEIAISRKLAIWGAEPFVSIRHEYQGRNIVDLGVSSKVIGYIDKNKQIDTGEFFAVEGHVNLSVADATVGFVYFLDNDRHVIGAALINENSKKYSDNKREVEYTFKGYVRVTNGINANYIYFPQIDAYSEING